MRSLSIYNVLTVLLVLAIASALLINSGCAIATPFRGPGYDASEGVTLDTAGDTVIVVITQAVLGDGDREGFDRGTRSVMDSMDRYPGLIAWSVRREVLGDNAWTMTVWTDDQSLNNFVYSKTHREAVDSGMPAVRQTRFHSFEAQTADLPISWDDALRRLDSEPYEDARPRASQLN